VKIFALSFFAALSLGVIHFIGAWLTSPKIAMHRAWLSFAGGSGVAYVFLHLLPELGVQQKVLEDRFGDPLFAGYVLHLTAIVGLASYFGMEQACTRLHAQGRHGAGEAILHFGSFAFYNAVIGLLTVQQAMLGLGPLLVFVVAIGLHFILNTHGIRKKHEDQIRTGRWVLSGAVLFGWGVGALIDIPQVAQALLFAFLVGGLTLNVRKEELPAENEGRFWAFGVGLVVYAVIAYALLEFFPGAHGARP